MQKVVYQDPDGNELSFGGTSESSAVMSLGVYRHESG